MTLFAFIVYLFIGGILGAIAGPITGGSTRSFVACALLGFMGALLGATAARLTQLPSFLGSDFTVSSLTIVWGTVGGILFILWGISAQVLFSSRDPATSG
jgi:uncharacterized membrane protein YeaQ/YmgE (transglycosylase-associated protein family)